MKKFKKKKFKNLLIPKFDKSIDDRSKKFKWQKIKKRPDIVILEGWCVGATHQKDSDLKKPLNSIEKKFDQKLIWRRKVNYYLKNQYKKIFKKIDKLVYLKAPNFSYIYKWRLLQEQKMKLTLKNKKTMSKQQVKEFIMYYERITKHMIKNFYKISDMTIFLDKYHRSKKLNFIKMIKKLLIVFIILLLPNKTFAQDLIKTLSDAFENNSKLNAERASYKASRQDVNISKGEFLPSVTLSGDLASQENSKRTDQTGTKLADTSSSPETQSILIEQKIFDGFGNYNSLKKSQLELRHAKFKLDKLEQEILLDAANAYYSLGYSFKNLEFNTLNFELFERQVESDRARLERGEISLTDFAQSESSLAGAQAKLITARNELVSGQKNFQKIIGSKAPDDIDLAFFPNLNIPSSLSTATSIAEQINPRLNLAKLDLEIAKKNLFIARGDLSPSAKVSYSLKKNQDLSSTVDERDQEEIKATITWPIFDGGKNLSSVKKAKFKLEEKQLNYDDIYSQVQIETANAWTAYSASKGILDATEAQLKAAEIANEGITLEYDTGNQRTTLEVIQSRTLLLESRTSYAKAQKGFCNSPVQFTSFYWRSLPRQY